MNDRIAIVVLDQNAVPLAVKIKHTLPNTEIHGLTGRVSEGVDQGFTQTADHLRHLYASGYAIIGLCASGILIRALAPHIKDKHTEPPVIAVASDGSGVVPLLGGHHGANDLAQMLADRLHMVAVITTAGDVRLGLALDEPPAGWHMQNPAAAKIMVASLIAGEPVALTVEAGDAAWLEESSVEFTDSADLSVRVTDQSVVADDKTCVLNPPNLVVGVGCERHTDSADLIGLVEDTLRGAGLTRHSVSCVASIDLKADEQAVHDLAAYLGVPARFFNPAELEAESPRLQNPSDIVFHETGCHGVAEGGALAGVGAGGDLVVAKRKSGRATCAIARGAGNIDAQSVGRPQGLLSVVGIGPGSDEWRTPQATQALALADDVVGYGLYLDLVSEVIAGKTRHESELSQEEARVRRALELAAEGRRVALVCSGDAGIYALAALVFELLERENRADWNRVNVVVCPGVSAVQAAASRIGAPIGHDFCTISLSDLLTPWDVVRQRLEGAAAGDFVVALYNPVSKKRRKHIKVARDILLSHRPADTPVVLARNLGREGENISVIPLEELGPDKADMLTLVLIGNSQSRAIQRGEGRRVYTPRGYASKMTGAARNQSGDAA